MSTLGALVPRAAAANDVEIYTDLNRGPSEVLRLDVPVTPLRRLQLLGTVVVGVLCDG